MPYLPVLDSLQTVAPAQESIRVPRVTIIICTRNRAKSIAATLESIAAAIRNASDLAAEVVLVDNASTDHTKEVIRRWADSMPFPAVTVFEARPGLSAARNGASVPPPATSWPSPTTIASWARITSATSNAITPGTPGRSCEAAASS